MVKDEYKETDKGAIPCEWDITTLGQIGDPKMCKRVLKEQTATQGEIPFFKIGTFGRTPDAFISRELFENFRSRFSYPRKGDILLSAAGTIGRTVIFDGKDAYFQDSNIVWIDNDEQKVTNEYLYYVYDAIKWKTADGGTVSRLYNELLKSTPIVLPPIDEQKAIASALSDVDELIANLEKLIEKKKAIKQGVMQELLTGKKRLPGFVGTWKNIKFKEANIEVLKGQIITQKESSIGNIPVIAGGKTPAYYCDKFNRTGKNITISASGASAGFVNKYSGNIFASDCSTISESYKYDIDFVYYLLLNVQTAIYALQTGGAQPHIHPKDIYEIDVCYTFDLSEQTAIASILSDMDNEIEALEQKLVKTRYLKQGMMQQLLTGEIRLV